MATIWGPADVTASLVAYYQRHRYDARTRVPIKRVPGMIRVTRIGGGPVNEAQDEARILVEVWEKDQSAAFDLARDLWALAAVIDEGDQEALPGLITYLVVPDFPVQYPDDHAPDLDRHQFTVTARVGFEEVNVP